MDPSTIHRAWLAGCLGSVVLAGCGDDVVTIESERDTLVVVSPDDFLGDVACAEWPGAMRRYSATLIDVTDDLVDAGAEVERFTLPSSGLVDCRYPVGFGRVVIGHSYVARVEGYDRVDLDPAAPGSPLMLDPEGDLVAPRWQTNCGRVGALGADGPISPIRLGSVFVTGCEPLQARSRPPLSAVRVELDVAFGAESCTNDGGEVARFEAQIAGSEAVHAAPCGESIELVALSPGAGVSLRVTAYGADDDQPRWTTTCRAVPKAGAAVVASCELLSEEQTDPPAE